MLSKTELYDFTETTEMTENLEGRAESKRLNEGILCVKQKNESLCESSE